MTLKMQTTLHMLLCCFFFLLKNFPSKNCFAMDYPLSNKCSKGLVPIPYNTVNKALEVSFLGPKGSPSPACLCSPTWEQGVGGLTLSKLLFFPAVPAWDMMGAIAPEKHATTNHGQGWNFHYLPHTFLCGLTSLLL